MGAADRGECRPGSRLEGLQGEAGEAASLRLLMTPAPAGR